MSIDNNRNLNSKLCTYNKNDVVFYYVNSHKAGWRAHEFLQNSEIVILWMQNDVMLSYHFRIYKPEASVRMTLI